MSKWKLKLGYLINLVESSSKSSPNHYKCEDKRSNSFIMLSFISNTVRQPEI